MYSFNLFARLQFQDYPALNNYIESITAFQLSVLISYRQWPLSLKNNIAHTQLMAKAFFISRFKKPGSKFFMHLNGGTDNLTA